MYFFFLFYFIYAITLYVKTSFFRRCVVVIFTAPYARLRKFFLFVLQG